MQSHHLAVELGRGGLVPQPVDGVLQVLPALIENPRVVREMFVLVACDNEARGERLDPIDAVEPGTQAAVPTLSQHLVHAVVDHIARHHQAEGWHVQDRGVVGVGVTGVHRQQLPDALRG